MEMEIAWNGVPQRVKAPYMQMIWLCDRFLSSVRWISRVNMGGRNLQS